MAAKLKTSLPEFMDLGGGWILEWDAVDPTTGASVAGVIVSGTSLTVAGDLGPDGGGKHELVEAPLLAHDQQSA